MDIKPCHEQIAQCPRGKLSYGFPISYEWFDQLYETMKKKGEVEDYPNEFLSTTSAIASLCQSIYPDWPHIKVVSVLCGTYGDYASCLLIRVGAAGWKPRNEVINKMANEVRKFGLVEKPGWFPTLDLKGAFTTCEHDCEGPLLTCFQVVLAREMAGVG